MTQGDGEFTTNISSEDIDIQVGSSLNVATLHLLIHTIRKLKFNRIAEKTVASRKLTRLSNWVESRSDR